MTETEVRGKLNKKKFEYLLDFLKSTGELKDHYHRLSVDISPGFDETTRTWNNVDGFDIRVKKSDDEEKISLKVGKYTDKERREVEVKFATGQIMESLELFEVLGYKSGMIYHWESWEFSYQGFEVKLSKYNDDYYTFEIEGKIKKDVEGLTKELKLTTYTDDGYKSTIEWENQNLHQVYSKKKVQELLKYLF